MAEAAGYMPALDLTGPAHHLDEHAAALRAQEPTLMVQTEVRVGSAAAKLLEAAAEHHVHLVVMSTHSRSGAARWVRGSVAEKMLHYGAAPILLVRSTDDLSTMEGEPDKGVTVLVPLDRSELALSALSEALRLVRAFEGSDPVIVLFMAMDERTLPVVGRAWDVAHQERSRASALQQAHAYLGAAASCCAPTAFASSRWQSLRTTWRRPS